MKLKCNAMFHHHHISVMELGHLLTRSGLFSLFHLGNNIYHHHHHHHYMSLTNLCSMAKGFNTNTNSTSSNISDTFPFMSNHYTSQCTSLRSILMLSHIFFSFFHVIVYQYLFLLNLWKHFLSHCRQCKPHTFHYPHSIKCSIQITNFVVLL